MIGATLRWFLVVASLAMPCAAADEAPLVDPHAAKRGLVCQWHAADGLKYEYYVPESYDATAGANLTLVLHGNGLDQRWTFANHPAGKFRPDDIVVSPDGTTFVKTTNANEFQPTDTDTRRIHDLLAELKQAWKLNQVFLYGHSQGSFFCFHYAGAYPDEVDGICAASSGAWNMSTISTKGRHQAIGILHGTRDGNVPYGQSWWTRKEYAEKAKYPLVHLRTLFDWGHPPVWRQAELVLAWCEGMTSTKLAREQACLLTLGAPDVPLGLDWAALWAVADRLAHEKSASEELRAQAAGAAQKVDALAAAHVAQIESGLGKGGVVELKHLQGGPVVGHLVRFLEEFDGVPAREQWVKKNAATFKALDDTAKDAYDDYQRLRAASPEKAFAAGLQLVDAGYTHYDTPAVIDQGLRWLAAPDFKVSDADRKRFTELADVYRSGRKSGFAEFDGLNAGVKPLE